MRKPIWLSLGLLAALVLVAASATGAGARAGTSAAGAGASGKGGTAIGHAKPLPKFVQKAEAARRTAPTSLLGVRQRWIRAVSSRCETATASAIAFRGPST